MTDTILKSPFTTAPHTGDIALRIGTAHIECDVNWTFTVRFDSGHEYLVTGFEPRADSTMEAAFCSLLTFFMAWDEANWAADTGENAENTTLFPVSDTELKNWACLNNNEMLTTWMTLDELADTSERLIIEPA